MDKSTVPVLPPNTTVKLDIVAPEEKHVVLVIRDIESIAHTILHLAGQDKMADGLLAIGALAEVALEGYEDGAAVEITVPSILALLPQSTPLAPAKDAAGTPSKNPGDGLPITKTSTPPTETTDAASETNTAGPETKTE